MTVTPANVVDACADEYTTAYTYDLNNRLLLEEKREKNRTERLWYAYDANGSQTRKEREVLEKKPGHSPGKIGFVTGHEAWGTATLDTRSYNGFGQQVGVTLDTLQIRYSYRPDGMRHSKTVRENTTLHHWDGQSIVLESNAQNRQTKARYVRGSGLIAQVVDLSLFFYLFNAHGDVIQRIRDNGEATPTYRYDAFGNQKPRGFVQATGLGETDPNPFRYCGEYFDSETGEVYLRARYYDTATGRFGREDPARGGNNWYSYCDNAPIMRADPTGLDWGWDPHAPPGQQKVWYPDVPTPGSNGYVPTSILRPDSIKPLSIGDLQEMHYDPAAYYARQAALANARNNGATPEQVYAIVIAGDPLGGRGGLSSDWGSDFGGPNNDRKDHRGVDTSTSQVTGVGLYSTWYGTVVENTMEKHWSWGYNIVIALTDRDGNPITDGSGRQIYIRLAHMEFASGFEEGSTIAVGDRIGTVGSTGVSSGPHLHLEAFVYDEVVNPNGTVTKTEVLIDPWPFLFPAPRP